MTKFIRTGMGAMLTAALLAGATISPASAQDEGRQFSAKAGEIVNESMILANDGETQAAVQALQKIISDTGLNPYERSTIYQMLGQYSHELGRSMDAQENFKNAIEAGGLRPKEVETAKIVIVKIMIGNAQFTEGAQRLEAYFDAGGEQKPEYIDLLVKAWMQAEDYKRALPWAEKWFAAAKPRDRRHFDMMNFLYNHLGMQGRQADIVKQMIARWPDDKSLWDALASMLANGGREDEAFEVKKIMYLKGLLTTEPELLKVVQYYSFYDMPYQAAEILEAELDAKRIARTPANLKQLSGLFRQARDYRRAIPILEAAASLSGDAKTYAELGEALYNEGDCQESEAAFTEAINRGYDAGKSWMLIASCRYDQTPSLDRLECDMTKAQMAEAPITKTRESAIAAFNKVPRGSSETGNARKWVQFITAEKDAVAARCDVNIKIEKERCFQIIKQAYDAIIFTGQFELEDETCGQYKTEYDAKYRQAVAAQ